MNCNCETMTSRMLKDRMLKLITHSISTLALVWKAKYQMCHHSLIFWIDLHEIRFHALKRDAHATDRGMSIYQPLIRPKITLLVNHHILNFSTESKHHLPNTCCYACHLASKFHTCVKKPSMKISLNVSQGQLNIY